MSENIVVNIPKVKRVKTSMWFDPLVYKPFVRAVHSIGDSTCGMLEPVMYGITEAIKRGIPIGLANLTLNLTVNRITQRERRKYRRGKDDVEVIATGSRMKCSFCDRRSEYETTRYPSPLICIKEYVCSICKWRLSHMVKTIAIEAI